MARLKKWTMIIDVARCTNCQNCVLATRDEYTGNEFPGYTASLPESAADWITVERRARGNDSMVDVTYLPRMCNHCEEAPCIRAAGGKAIYRRDDGIVVIDPVEARGRRDLIESCPYGVISWNEQAQVPQKWSFDAHLLDAGWSQPRCVQACPTGAMQSARLTDVELQELRGREELEELRPDLQSRPRVLYRNLHKVNRLFVGGTVTRRRLEGGSDNVAEAEVELLVPGASSATICRTDIFGDFKFDNLQAAAGVSWTLRASHPEYGHASAAGTLSESCYIGSLVLA